MILRSTSPGKTIFILPQFCKLSGQFFCADFCASIVFPFIF